ncbi:DMT family transporter [Clostridium lundense]|uniref:DMT family transporter n=1 Tax=Clostridium lundense TaxID=319475 RepID=UPI000483A5FE|nr:DMT family transporter [Clostridium lundense]
MYKLSAVVIGFLIAIMVTINGTLSKGIGDYKSVLIIHIVGLIAVSFVLLLRKEKLKIKEKLPIYLFSAGAIGVFVVLFNNITFNKLGASLTLSLGLFGQLIMSGIIDHFGLFGMEVSKFKPKKTIGFFMVLIGIIVMVVY